MYLYGCIQIKFDRSESIIDNKFNDQLISLFCFLPSNVLKNKSCLWNLWYLSEWFIQKLLSDVDWCFPFFEVIS